MKSKKIKLPVLAIIAIISLTANAQVSAFEKYSDIKNVTYVYISKSMLNLVGGAVPSVPGVNTKSIMGKLSAIQIISSEDKSARNKLKANVASTIKNGKYELLMQVDNNDKVYIYHKESKNQSVIVMQTDNDDALSVIVFSGKFTLDDVKKLTDNKK